LGGAPARGGAHVTDDLSLVSVIFPVSDVARYLGRAREAAIAHDYPRERLEVLVMDGGSRDGTRALVEAARACVPRVRLLDNPQGIVTTGMNLGIRAARGHLIVCVDGHAIVGPDHVRRCVLELARTG